MVNELPEELREQAKFLLTCPSNQANLRRAVSAAYYGLFHLLIRDAISNWKHPVHHSRMARAFDHQKMKAASRAMIQAIGTDFDRGDSGSTEQLVKRNVVVVAQAFIELQEARHQADYDMEKPFEEADAAVLVDQADSAFAAFGFARHHPIAQDFLYSLLFRDRS